MMFYTYGLDGCFTYIGDDAAVFDGADPAIEHDMNAQLESAGWEVMLEHDHGLCAGDSLRVYRHSEGDFRGLFVDVSDFGNMAYTCLVNHHMWPQFYRTELVPIMRARDLVDINLQIKRLSNLVSAIAKHGLETPVDWLDGTSLIDRKQEADRHKQIQADLSRKRQK